MFELAAVGKKLTKEHMKLRRAEFIAEPAAKRRPAAGPPSAPPVVEEREPQAEPEGNLPPWWHETNSD